MVARLVTLLRRGLDTRGRTRLVSTPAAGVRGSERAGSDRGRGSGARDSRTGPVWTRAARLLNRNGSTTTTSRFAGATTTFHCGPARIRARFAGTVLARTRPVHEPDPGGFLGGADQSGASPNEDELRLISMPMWVLRSTRPTSPTTRRSRRRRRPDFPPDALVNEDYERCQAEAERLRERIPRGAGSRPPPYPEP